MGGPSSVEQVNDYEVKARHNGYLNSASLNRVKQICEEYADSCAEEIEHDPTLKAANGKPQRTTVAKLRKLVVGYHLDAEEEGSEHHEVASEDGKEIHLQVPESIADDAALDDSALPGAKANNRGAMTLRALSELQRENQKYVGTFDLGRTRKRTKNASAPLIPSTSIATASAPATSTTPTTTATVSAPPISTTATATDESKGDSGQAKAKAIA